MTPLECLIVTVLAMVPWVPWLVVEAYRRGWRAGWQASESVGRLRELKAVAERPEVK